MLNQSTKDQKLTADNNITEIHIFYLLKLCHAAGAYHKYRILSRGAGHIQNNLM